jgi:dTDP-3-amino-3,4,6-trideoxy-alpha-D-glucose transaminase
MLVPFFDLSSQVRTHRDELHSILDKTIDAGLFIGGRALEDFEGQFSNYLNVDHAMGVGNGLDALRLVLEGWGIGPGDEVIVPGFTFYATWLAVMQVGAIPVFVDVESDSANLNPDLVEGAISSRTKAIIVVHLFGWPAQMMHIMKLAQKHGIKVLEDAAQAHGASRDGRMVGSIGHAAAFSFYPTKNLGALGDGGAVTTNDAYLAGFVSSRRSYGVGKTKYEHQDFGWNSRLDSIQARVLSLGLSHLDDWNTARRRIAASYRGALSEVTGCSVGPQNVIESVWHHFILKCRDRNSARSFLMANGVSTDIHYPYYSYSVKPVIEYLRIMGLSPNNNLPVSKQLSDGVVSLPIGPWMSEAQIEHVSGVLSKIPPKLLFG